MNAGGGHVILSNQLVLHIHLHVILVAEETLAVLLRPPRVGIFLGVLLFRPLFTHLFGLASLDLLVLLASQSFPEFQAQLPRYGACLQDLQASWLLAIETRLNLPIGNYITTDLINPAAIVDMAGAAVGRIAQFLSTTFLVFLILIFMLGEAIVFPDKIRYLLGDESGDEDRLTKVVAEIQTYLGIKTMVSLATGLILGTWAFVMELDFPVLLGIIAFLLNYVPTVGSIIAAAPAVLLSLILHGTLPHFLLVTMGYVVVNTLFGNILEPNLMGRRLGLSTLVVILSLLFWGWAWGPIGALLSVPLTMIVKIALESREDTKWIAILLGTANTARSEAEAQ